VTHEPAPSIWRRWRPRQSPRATAHAFRVGVKTTPNCPSKEYAPADRVVPIGASQRRTGARPFRHANNSPNTHTHTHTHTHTRCVRNHAPYRGTNYRLDTVAVWPKRPFQVAMLGRVVFKHLVNQRHTHHHTFGQMVPLPMADGSCVAGFVVRARKLKLDQRRAYYHDAHGAKKKERTTK
jgi:hypothetical protein